MDLKVNFSLWSKIDMGDFTNYKNKILKVQLQKFLHVGFFTKSFCMQASWKLVQAFASPT
jgi:hypothetical protein